MPSHKIYRWFDVVDEIMPEMRAKTTGTLFAAEANEIIIEYEQVRDIFFDHVTEIGNFEVGKKAIDLWSRMQNVQQRLCDLSDKIDRPN